MGRSFETGASLTPCVPSDHKIKRSRSKVREKIVENQKKEKRKLRRREVFEPGPQERMGCDHEYLVCLDLHQIPEEVGQFDIFFSTPQRAMGCGHIVCFYQPDI